MGIDIRRLPSDNQSVGRFLGAEGELARLRGIITGLAALHARMSGLPEFVAKAFGEAITVQGEFLVHADTATLVERINVVIRRGLAAPLTCADDSPRLIPSGEYADEGTRYTRAQADLIQVAEGLYYLWAPMGEYPRVIEPRPAPLAMQGAKAVANMAEIATGLFDARGYLGAQIRATAEGNEVRQQLRTLQEESRAASESLEVLEIA